MPRGLSPAYLFVISLFLFSLTSRVERPLYPTYKYPAPGLVMAKEYRRHCGLVLFPPCLSAIRLCDDSRARCAANALSLPLPFRIRSRSPSPSSVPVIVLVHCRSYRPDICQNVAANTSASPLLLARSRIFGIAASLSHHLISYLGILPELST